MIHYAGPNSSHRGSKRQKPQYSLEYRELGLKKAGPRIRTACDACKARKLRCSGHSPCARCSIRQESCNYRELRSSAPNANAALNEGPTPYEHSSISTVEQSSEILDASWLSAACSTSQCAEFAENDYPAELHGHSLNEDGIGEGTSVLSLQQDQYGHMHGSSSTFAFLNFAKQKLCCLPSTSIDFCDYPLPGFEAHSSFPPSREVTDELIRVFFEHGLNTSRCVHEKMFQEDYERLFASNCDRRHEPDALALIYMVIALGSHYSKSENRWSGYVASVQFYETAQAQLRISSSQITLKSLQARLLGVHYLLNHSKIHEAWTSFGIVVRHIQALGLHRCSNRNSRDCIVDEVRKRVFWVAYINDRILSSIFGRPCAIRDDEIDQEECVAANDEDMTVAECRATPPYTVCKVAALIHYARLASILGAILRQFYFLTNEGRLMAQIRCEVKKFEISLSDWKSALPGYLNFAVLPSCALSVAIHRQMSTLKLTYAYTLLLLYRPTISQSIVASTKSPQQTDFDQWVKDIHEKSNEAAKMIISECQSLHSRGLFSRTFWMCNYAHFTAVGALYMYCFLWPDAEHVWEAAEDARAQLFVGVKGDLVGQTYIEVLSQVSQMVSEQRRSKTCISTAIEFHEGLGAPDYEMPSDFGGWTWSDLPFGQDALAICSSNSGVQSTNT